MGSTLIRNIKNLVIGHQNPVNGTEMSNLPAQEDAFILLENGKVSAYGKSEYAPERADEIVDAAGKMVFPSFVDSHTHLVYAASREQEFVDRIKGLTYEEIAARGGGILN
ncbi:MAG: imidazolonepropionase, partial [Saprospiraceae bacterium]|nr:imidazolonepropionase [Saprospiraceae bacterium]